uniref:HORMA domain-containing protein n=1 Tax=Bicosoecida sp. CB-2014 TaxID=1486930 RepID=A0A7S1G3K4_9STRA|mmetsp:Transcript_11177/g.38890  ORF Transcript_11177/g.38890 Transcript_11177/m.38890 type:complete len:211 (+) Transcript_11177:163-795(+)
MAAAGTATDTKNIITLKGSVEIVTEFFGFSINSILYQRGIYPPESFSAVSQYGLSMLVTTDDGLKGYLSQVLGQLSSWLSRGEVQKLVVVITGVDSGDVLERWVFNVETDKSITASGGGVEKSAKEIQKEIQAIIRQITASVSFLPLLDEPCTFDLLVYTDADTDVPRSWEESDPQYISNSTEVRLRSFTTKVHKVDAMVAYKTGDDDDV